MLSLAHASLRVELLDPADAADQPRQGTRYCHGGYIWQVHDRTLGPLLAGPEFPAPAPTPFNGQGLPESFRHRTRDGRPLTWEQNEGLGLGVGLLHQDAARDVSVGTPGAWQVERGADWVHFTSTLSGAGRAATVRRELRLHDRTLVSRTTLRNTGTRALDLQWFAHPFWPLSAGRARIALPRGASVAENPGFAVDAAGLLTFRRPFVGPDDSQFALLHLPPGQPLELTLDHPLLTRVTFATDFVPDECPVWANAHTVSVEPYLYLQLAPGASRTWQLTHTFVA